MAEVTVKDFADVVGISVDRLVGQLKDAGLQTKKAEDSISDDEKSKLLAHLRQMHGKHDAPDNTSEPTKVTLRRKSVSELSIPSGRTATRARPGGSKTVSVEVRKKRTYMKRSVIVEEEQRKTDEERKQLEKIEAEKLAQEAKVARQQDEKLKAKQAEEDSVARAKEEEESRKRAVEEAALAAKKAAEEELAAQEKAKAAETKSKKGKEEKKTRYGRNELHCLLYTS